MFNKFLIFINDQILSVERAVLKARLEEHQDTQVSSFGVRGFHWGYAEEVRAAAAGNFFWGSSRTRVAFEGFQKASNTETRRADISPILLEVIGRG